MKVVRFIIAIVAALWTAGVAVGVVREFGTHEGVRGTTQIFAGVGATAACFVITIWLFKWALRPHPPSDEPEDRPGT